MAGGWVGGWVGVVGTWLAAEWVGGWCGGCELGGMWRGGLDPSLYIQVGFEAICRWQHTALTSRRFDWMRPIVSKSLFYSMLILIQHDLYTENIQTVN